MRKGNVVGSLLVLGMIVALPGVGYAQESTFSGTVTDSTGGVLPRVTVTATNLESGNTFVAVTDEHGNFRLSMRVGNYRITAELAGFTTVNRGLQMLLGQNAGVNVQMAPSTVQESVTVTGEAPLIHTTISTLGSNIDPRQMQELPINGRNWMDLTVLAPGNRRNESGGLPMVRQGYAQITMDGQQVTTNYHSATDAEQPKYSRDGIGEFEIITNRFDATHGRSAGVIVNAITKSGTNLFAGTFSGYFRDEKFNAADFIQKRVLPYSNQQVSTTFGGPIRRDRMHFFFLYEYEREPKTFTYNSPYPSFNIDISFPRRVDTAVGRFDFQFTPQARLSLRGQGYQEVFYGQGGNSATTHPANSGTRGRDTNQFYGTFTQVLSNRMLNEIRGGSTAYDRKDQPAVQWQGGPFPYRPVLNGGSVAITLRGYSIGSQPQHLSQDTWSIRDDLSTSYNWGGRHDLKVGGEYLYYTNQMRACNGCMGQMDARGGPVPANLEALFPVWNDASTWNLAPLSPIVIRVGHLVSNTEFQYTSIRHILAGWAQDDWKATDRLTLNLGLRYDLDMGAHSEKVLFKPWLPGDLPHDTNNFGPRLGFAYSLNDRTALRGGYGLFFAQVSNDGVQQTDSYQISIRSEIDNDGRPDFAATWFPGGGEWFNGPTLTFEQVLAGSCDQNFVPGCLRRALTSEINHPWRRDSYSHQASIGVQRQLGPDMSIEANYVYTGGRLEEDDQFNNQYNVNLSYDPATGANYPFSDISRRPFPDWGIVNLELLEGRSNSHAGQFTFTKRLSHRWQATANYTLSGFWDANFVRDQFYLGADGVIARRPIGFVLARDLGGEYTLAAGDQRHRAVVNGIWDLGYDVQLSGIYFFGSGERRLTNTGLDLRNQGAQAESRLRANGTIVPRNTLVGDPIHRVDLRLEKRLPLSTRVRVDGMLEVFNLFNHVNYGSYVTNESNRQYGRPSANTNIAYQPRVLQLGFRTAF